MSPSSTHAKRPTNDANNMILTTCAACAAPLANDHKKRCSRCKTILTEIKRACRIFAMQDQFNAELAQDFENLRMQEEDSK